ncbi:MAG TPA: succinylglutamate desuccinylase/aspartoacylase family protein [Patescibacteria group bacterium]|nr:succinylglutamate desuccinylase/aspartoacylase family protein [bacterium]HRY56599.1 succinylglutamate desuccinylase/aspartoacylase family protein [Patescibacteria group bacterium]
MKKTITKIKIGQAGAVSIEIPVLKFTGSKRGKKALIVCGIHGDEYTGLLVINNVLEKIKDIQGELWIIPSANALAQALNIRINPLDLYDLNRKFPGDKTKEPTDRIAAEIFEIAKDMDAVLDFHTFEDPTVVTNIFMNCGSNETKKKTLEFIKLFDPDIVWELNIKSRDELKFVTALGPKLSFEGIPNIAVELPQLHNVSDEQIERAVDGTIKILNNLKITNVSHAKESRELLFVENKEFNSNVSGIFVTHKKLMDKIKKGEVVGGVIDITSFKKTQIKSHESGVLMVLKDRQFVTTGGRLFTVGKLKRK